MIRRLRIRNLATIEDVEMRFAPGFTILTGETGAGKSIVMDAIRLLAGEKGSPDLVRTGVAEAAIEGVFEVPAAAAPPDGTPPGDGEVLVQRQISDQGGGRVYLDGVLTPLRRLKELGSALLDVYGQNDHVFLLHLENHLVFVDAFAGAGPLREETAAAARALKALLQKKRDLLNRQKERRQRLDYLAFQIREIEAASLRPGEDERLRRDREFLKNAEKISRAVTEALEIGFERDDSLLPGLKRFRALLDGLAPYSPALEAAAAPLEEARIALQEMSSALVDLRERQSGEESLEAVEERLSVIEKLQKKYGPAVADVCAHLEAAKAEEKELAGSEERLADLDREIAAAARDYAARAAALTARRAAAAGELRTLVEKEIALLGMKRARFEVRVETAAFDPAAPDGVREDGCDTVEFMISPNPGEDLRPLRRIASGGELSRVMLALKSIGRDAGPPQTLIFDEVDAGIGGKTADAIAERLRGLAARHQVLCITHLPQIASHAEHHFRVEKRVEKDRTFTGVQELTAEERVGEIARLLAGSRVSEASLETARQMLRPPDRRRASGGAS